MDLQKIYDDLHDRYSTVNVYTDNDVKIRLHVNLLDPRKYHYSVWMPGYTERTYHLDVVSALNEARDKRVGK